MYKTTLSLHSGILVALLGSLLWTACDPSKRAVSTTPNRKPVPSRPTMRPETPAPMDTIRWTTAPAATPPIGNAPGTPVFEPYAGQTYRLALLLPFLTDQASPDAPVPLRSTPALHFYSGAQLALQKLSTEEGMNLSVEVLDTRFSDADFTRLLRNPRLEKAQVIIGPIRSSHVNLLAAQTQKTGQILVSPESPIMSLTSQNPDFIQTNPSLRAHCLAITRHALERNLPDAITLVCQQKEANRLPYFQEANPTGNPRFAELVVPDGTTSFDAFNLKKYLKPGRRSVFILPTWSSQDFVMAFLQQLRTVKGDAEVAVYGMPQWRGFEQIEPEYFQVMQVHISSASYLDRNTPEAQAFREAFYEATGTVPNEDAYTGYDVTLLVGTMLKRYGLSFPQQLTVAEPVVSLQNQFQFAKVYATPPEAGTGADTDLMNRYDYLENIHVFILKFENYQFVPAE
ncbi:MAG: hypothetical protein EP344_15725 [Bacteroidetes bacterium]|nr:MAG: hypothetical protein EP344_15725 [Bacteroidota bacterium]